MWVYISARNKWFALSGTRTPNQTYWSVEYVPQTKTARFATYGRGVWDFQVKDIISTVEEVETAFQVVSIFPNPATDYISISTDEGKMTSPIIFAYQQANDDEKAFWKRTFEDHQITDDDLATAKTLIKAHQADTQTYDLAVSYVKKAVAALAPVPDSPLKTTLENLASFALAPKN